MTYVSLTSSFSVVAVRNMQTGDLEWVDKIRDDEHYRKAYEEYPRWDLNRKKYVRNERSSGSTGR